MLLIFPPSLAGEVIKSWKNRYFVLSQGHLQYFENQLKAQTINNSRPKPKGSISISQARLSLPEKGVKNYGKDNCFILRPFNTKRFYALVAASASSLEAWYPSLSIVPRMCWPYSGRFWIVSDCCLLCFLFSKDQRAGQGGGHPGRWRGAKRRECERGVDDG